MKSKRLISLIMAVMMILSCAFCAGFTVSAEVTSEQSPATQYGLGYTANDGLILQAWNWSYAEIQKNLQAIAEAGFTTIQISPPTELKEATKGVKILRKENDNGWWMMYQPAAYELNQSEDNVLGTKDELISMIDAAHEMGLFVIADAVINHLGNSETGDYKINGNSLPADANAVDYLCQRAWEFDSSKAIIDAGAFHYPYANCKYNDTGAFDCTQNAVSLLPDLDTSKPVVQETILDYWHECIDAGIDGFRIDAAKHIETKYDGEYASDFWDVLMYDGINGKQGIYPYAKDTYGKDLYMYGEILNTVSTERSFSWYLEYMNITNSTAFNDIRLAVNNGNAKNAVPESFNNGMSNKTAVLWDESHDTYMDDCKSKHLPSVKLLTKRWACMASRADVVCMYLARPTNKASEIYDLDLGTAYDTAWNDKETAVINKFHNHFQGAGEAVSSSGNIAIVERGYSGVVLVNCKGDAADVSVPVQMLADGTYIDQMTGNTFTVANGTITGTMGETGVAVIYNPETAVVTATKENCNFTTESIMVDVVANGTVAAYQINDEEPVEFTGKKTLEVYPVLEPDYRLIGVLGDVDCNETLNVRDATAIQKHIADIAKLSEDGVFLADSDQNGTVNIKDATAIQKHIAGIASGCQMLGEPVGTGSGEGVATLTLSYGDAEKTYTYNKVSKDNMNWVKFDNSQSKWSKVYCYAFCEEGGQNNAWPGVLMTEGEGDIWYYELPEDLEGAIVIFSDNVLGTGQQTGNLPTKNTDTGELYSKHFIFTNSKWNAINSDGSYTELEETRSGYYVVFTDANGWKSGTKGKMCYYAWGGGPAVAWPGVEMELLGQDENGNNQYFAWIDRGYTNIIFNANGKQTSDLSVQGNYNYVPNTKTGSITCDMIEITPPEE